MTKLWYNICIYFFFLFILSLTLDVDVTTAVDIYSFGMCALEVRLILHDRMAWALS